MGAGHPDKVADAISDAILDACIAQDPESRVGCETLVKGNQVILAGEITTKAKLDYEKHRARHSPQHRLPHSSG